jgi:hypothetical protein
LSSAHSNALRASSRVLRLLIVLNVLMGLAILLLLLASLVAEQWVMTGLGIGDAPRLGLGARLIMVIGIFAAPLTHLVLIRLEAIVATVRAGDPFVAGNVSRLQQIAWAVLGLELLHLGVGVVREFVSSESVRLDLDWSFSLAPWLAVLLLFVLAQVFDHGTRMRDELEGTV